MGSMKDILGMIPGLGKWSAKDMEPMIRIDQSDRDHWFYEQKERYKSILMPSEKMP